MPGEMAGYLLNGDDCSGCGEYLGDGPGHPRWCSRCHAPSTPGRIRLYAPGYRPSPPAGQRNPPQPQNPPYPSKNAKNRAKKARRRERDAQAKAQGTPHA